MYKKLYFFDHTASAYITPKSIVFFDKNIGELTFFDKNDFMQWFTEEYMPKTGMNLGGIYKVSDFLPPTVPDYEHY